MKAEMDMENKFWSNFGYLIKFGNRLFLKPKTPSENIYISDKVHRGHKSMIILLPKIANAPG